MTTANHRFFTLDDIPEGKGKEVLMKILYSPRPNREELFRKAGEYEEAHADELYGPLEVDTH